MKIQSLCLTAGLTLALAAPALAQGNDAAYCQALVSKYQQYVTGTGSGRHGENELNANAKIAIDKCNAGDASGIPVLEQELKNAKVTLPQRS
jgi:hypothetical protein